MTPHQPDNAIEQATIPVLTFCVANQVYALPVASVTQIIEMVTITTMPQMPDFVMGIINFRGVLVPVIDLRLRFGLPFVPYGLNTPMILVDFNGRNIAVVVDDVENVIEIDPNQIEASTAVIPNELLVSDEQDSSSHIASIAHAGRSILPILNIAALLTRREAKQVIQALNARQTTGAAA